MALFRRKSPRPPDADAASDSAPTASAEAPGAKKRGLFRRLAGAIGKTRKKLVGGLVSVLTGRGRIDEELLEDVYDVLVEADMGTPVVDALTDELRAAWKRGAVETSDDVVPFLKQHIIETLTEKSNALSVAPEGPTVILVVGVNGTGKTTSIGRLAWHLKEAGQRVLIAAADTFRAGAENQLKVWAEERVGVDFVAAEESSTGVGASRRQDPAAVAYKACERVLAEGHDVLIVDTAGRLHTQKNLMAQLEKIRNVLAKQIPGAPHEVLLVLDATTGQNAVYQAEHFRTAAGVTGLFLAKLDSTAKGGAVLAIHEQVEIPVKFVGLGEQKEDLAPFRAAEFVEALFSTGTPE